MNDRYQDAAPWSTRKPAWSPLLVLGGSVVAAVMLISGGLSVLGTEATRTAPSSRAALVANPSAQGTTVAVAVAADLKGLSDPALDKRR